MDKALKPLLAALATLTLQGITAQQMPYKATLEHTLYTEQSITTAGEIGTSALFTPESDFTIELGMLIHDTHQGSLEVRAANGDYKGFTASICSGSITFGIDNLAPEIAPASYPISKDGKAHTYRTILQGDKIHIYEDTTLLGTHTTEYFERFIMPDPFTDPDNKERKEGIYAEHTTAANLAAYWNYCDQHGRTPDSLLTMCGAGLKSDH